MKSQELSEIELNLLCIIMRLLLSWMDLGLLSWPARWRSERLENAKIGQQILLVLHLPS